MMPVQKSGSTLGYLSIILCCFTSAISFVFISNISKGHDEILSLAMTCGYGAILFNLFNFRKLAPLYRLVSKNVKLFLKMNVVTMFNWVGSFFCLKYVDAATGACIMLGVISVTTFFILIPIQRIKENKHLVFCILFILISMALIIGQQANLSFYSGRVLIFGVSWAVLSGVAGGFIGVNSERMGKVGFSVTQILATRFYLLISMSILILAMRHQCVPLVIDWKYYVVAVFFVVLLPLLMYQTAVRELSSLIVSLVEPFTPVIAYFIEIWLGHYRFNFLTVLLLFIASFAVLLLVRVEQKLARAKWLATDKKLAEDFG